MTKKLNAKQLQFCKEYLIDLNATQAAIRAGYSKKTARQKAHNLFTLVYIEKEIQRLIKKRSKRTEITIDRVLQELAIIGFLDIRNAFDDEGRLLPIHEMPEDIARALGGIDITTTKTTIDIIAEENVREVEQALLKKIKIIDKKGALELIGRHLAMFTDRSILVDEREDFEGNDPEAYVKDAISRQS